jgi:ATP-binding cassette subfamily C protein
VQAACLSALVNILYLAPTIYMMQVYDRVVPTGGLLTLAWITVVVGLAIGTLAALDALRARIMVRASLRLNRILSSEILDRQMAVTDGSTTNQAMREFDQLRQTLAGPAALALFDVPWTPIYLLVAFLIHPLLGIMVSAAGAVLVALAIANERRNKTLSIEASQANAIAYASQEATFRNAELVRALGMRRALVTKHIGERHAGLEANATVQFSGGRYTSVVKFVRMFMQSLALAAGAFLAVSGAISVGAIIAASVLLSRALQPIEQVVNLWPSILNSQQALRTLAKLFENTGSDPVHRTRLPDPVGKIELIGVTVRDAQGTGFILKNVSLTLNPGEVFGLIGPSGAGKSTLGRVMAGALKPDLGDVRIDDAKAEDWDPDLLAQHVGYLPQNCAMLPGTVGENISRFAAGRGVPPEEVDAEVIRAATLAGVHELILRLPGGYETMLAEGGYQLSGGETQRIGLARALFGRPKIIVLDEPNSALDADGEAALSRAVDAARLQGAAIMIIAHRGSLLNRASKLVLLYDGMVARNGPRTEVLEELNKAAQQANVVPIHERVQP